MDFQIVHMLILQVGFWCLTLHAYVYFTLSNHMLAFFFGGGGNNFSWGCNIFILTLSDQVLGSHSPCTYVAYTLQADVRFLKCFYFQN